MAKKKKSTSKSNSTVVVSKDAIDLGVTSEALKNPIPSNIGVVNGLKMMKSDKGKPTALQNSIFKDLPSGTPNKNDKGKEVVNLEEALDPMRNKEGNDLFAPPKNQFDYTQKTNEFIRKLFKPLDSLTEKSGNKVGKSVGGLLVDRPGSKGRTIGESLADNITDSLSKGGWLNGDNYIRYFDQAIISEKFPMIGGALSGYLDNYIIRQNNPQANSDFELGDLVADYEEPDPERGRLNDFLSNSYMHPMAAYGQGLGLAKPNANDYIFTSGGKVNLTQTQLNGLRRRQDALGQTNGAPPTDKEMASWGHFGQYMVNYLSDNYRKKNETYDGLLNLAEAADPYWERGNRHELAWDTLQNVKTNTVALIDGSGDFIQETWDNISENVRQGVENAYDNVNNALENLGFDKMLNPDLKKKADKWMSKMGFTKKRGGTDYEGFPSSGIMYSSIIAINGIEFPPESLIDYYEEHDYMEGSFPRRILRVLLPFELMSNPDAKEKLDPKKITAETKYKVTLARHFGFVRSQNYDTFSLTGNAVFREYESIIEYEGIPTISSYQNEYDEDFLDYLYKHGSPDEIAKKTMEVIQLELTSYLNPLMSSPLVQFSGIPAEDATIESILLKSFQDHFIGDDEHRAPAGPAMKLVMAKPEVSQNLNNIMIPNGGFPGVLEFYQKETGGKLFNGGVNIFQDHDEIFVLNKKGPNKIDYENEWKFQFRFTSPGSMLTDKITITSREEQKIIIGLNYEDAIKLGDPSMYNEKKTVNTQMAAATVVNTGIDGKIANTEFTKSHVGTVVTDETRIEEFDEFLIRIPNSLVVFRPGDDVKLRFSDNREYNGTIKKWAAEQNKFVRCILVWVTMREGEIKDSPEADIENNPVNKAIQKYKEKTAKWTDKISAKIEYWQSKLDAAPQNSLRNNGFGNSLYWNEKGEYIGPEHLMAENVRKGFEDLEQYDWYQETLKDVYGPTGLIKNRYAPSYRMLSDPDHFGAGARGIGGKTNTLFGER